MNELNVKEIRLNLGVSQEKFAKMLGVDIRTVQHWENGRVISDRNSVKIRKLLQGNEQQNTQEQNSQENSQDEPQKSEEKKSESRDKEVEFLRQQVADKEKVISSKEKVISLLEQQVADKNEIIALLKQKTSSEHSRPDVPISPYAVADIKDMI